MEATENIVPPSSIPQPPAGAAGCEADAETPSHLVELPGSDWQLWRWSCLRGTGFPARAVLKLSSQAYMDEERLLLEAEAEAESRRAEALAVAREVLEALPHGEEKDVRRRLGKAIRSLNNGNPPAPGRFEGPVEAALEAYRAACLRRDLHQTAFRRAFKEASSLIAKAIKEEAGGSRFQEAVIWQNRQAFHTAVAEVLRKEGGASPDNSKHRQHLELVASYLQRYSLKNDTIGFFGPVGWARFNPQGATLEARPGGNLLATREVYFETWCIDELIGILNKDIELRPWIAPRAVPYLHVEGTALSLPQSRRPLQLTRAQAAALQLCDGLKAARSVVASLRNSFPPEVKSEAAGYELLENLRSRGLLLWQLEFPPGVYPDRSLRAWAESIEDEGLRQRTLAPLAELEAGRDAVARAAGDPEQLERALDDLNAAFERITATASTRAAGEMYAARTLVYEDCRRDVEVEVGPELLERLSAPLSLLLTSARWFTYEIARYYRRVFKEVYDGLVREGKSGQVNGALFWYRAHHYLTDTTRTGSAHVLPEFQRRWAEVLSLNTDEKHVHLTVEQLRPLVEAAFAAPRPGWSTARHHSPDLMVAAADAEAVRRGDYQLILGEFHLGTNTLKVSLFVLQHPRPEEIFSATALDMPEVGMRIGTPKTSTGLTARTTPILHPADNLCLHLTYDSVTQPDAHNLPIGSMVVEQVGEDLLLRTRDGRLRFDIVEAFADILSSQTTGKFNLFQPVPHLPRVSLDGLLISRESWRFPVSELEFAFEKEDGQRFLAARRWAKAHDLPRFVFVKSPVEIKPFYVDFDSPIYVETFLKVVRRTQNGTGGETLIAISEMLPTHQQTWLTDAAGQHYTSEFRVVAVDPVR
ncbi:MAG: lantibiotic dehydratase [Pyrinomonadaceae bacterium]